MYSSTRPPAKYNFSLVSFRTTLNGPVGVECVCETNIYMNRDVRTRSGGRSRMGELLSYISAVASTTFAGGRFSRG